MKHVLDYFNSESPNVIEHSIKEMIDERNSYILSFCNLDDALYLDGTNISVECDFQPLMNFAKHLINEIPNIEYGREAKMTDNFNFRCFVIHQDTSSKIAQENT